MHLENFSPGEFREWSGQMSPRLTVLLDVLRFQVGAPVWISDHEDSLGRRLGPGKYSEHNVDVWGQVLAADVFIAGVYNREEADMVVMLATRLGFTGIGVYADTHNNVGEKQVMFHLGVRPTRKMGEPATWGRTREGYTSIEFALAQLAP